MSSARRVLLFEVVAPLALFYGLRALGATPLTALLAGAVIPLVLAVRELATRRRMSGVQVFLVGMMVLTVAASLASGDPRLLAVRNGWGLAALGCWMLVTLLARRPCLFEAGRLVLDDARQRIWQANWERYEPFRRLLRRLTAVWGVACLLDAGLRVVIVLTLPIDAVPLLDDVLLGVTLCALLLVNRFYGRPYLRRHGLRLRGPELMQA